MNPGERKAKRLSRAALCAIALAYVASRTWALTSLPMFFDEAIHLLWAERWSGAQGLAHALEDGKLLQVAASGLLLRLWPDALLAGRLASVAAGAIGLAAAILLGRRLAGTSGGLWTAALYVCCPLLLFHERMALADGFVSAFATLVLVCAIDLGREPRPARGVLLGLSMAAAVAAKATGLLSLASPLAAVLVLAPRDGRAWRALGVAAAVAAALVAWPLLVFLTRTGQIEDKAGSAGGDRLALVLRNGTLALEWLTAYWTVPVIVAGLVAAALALLRGRRVALVVASAAAVPPVFFVLVASTWYPRYVVLATPPLLALGGTLAAEWLQRSHGRARAAVALAVAAAFAPALVFDARLLSDPTSAPLPAVDRWQYVEGWPSGYGWKESAELIRRERGSGETRVVTERQHWTLKAYFIGQSGVVVKGFDLEEPSAAERIAAWLGPGEGWLVVSGVVPASGELERCHAGSFTKPGRQMSVTVYRLLSADREMPGGKLSASAAAAPPPRRRCP